MTEVYESPRQRSSENDPALFYSESDAESSMTSDHFMLKTPTEANSFHSSPEANNISPVLNSLPISRPLSRSSVTSGLSVTATKDGIEGKRVKKTGIPGYPLNLINKMYANYANGSMGIGNYLTPNDINPHDIDRASVENVDDRASVLSLSSMIPQYSKEETTDANENNTDVMQKNNFGDLEKNDAAETDHDYDFDVKSAGQDSIESSDYKTFLKRSSGV